MVSRTMYQPLADFLAAQQGDTVRLTWEEIEALLTFALPQSARQHPTWWRNREFIKRREFQSGLAICC